MACPLPSSGYAVYEASARLGTCLPRGVVSQGGPGDIRRGSTAPSTRQNLESGASLSISATSAALSLGGRLPESGQYLADSRVATRGVGGLHARALQACILRSSPERAQRTEGAAAVMSRVPHAGCGAGAGLCLGSTYSALRGLPRKTARATAMAQGKGAHIRTPRPSGHRPSGSHAAHY